MRYIRWTSYIITVAGVVLTAASAALGLNPTITLIGMMLAIAGIVKIVAVGIWHGIGGFGAPITAPEEIVPPSRPRRNR